jgi:Snare region anchored in the vesicle membrane C-terminus
LSRIRSFLAGSTRNQSTLSECERLLREARRCATAMQGLAEIAGDAMRVTEARNLVERDIQPLEKEVKKQLYAMGRQELMQHHQYQAPDIEGGNENTDLDSLIQSSDDLLRESQSILAETEEIGTTVLHQMGRQREQIQTSNQHLDAVRNVTIQAKNILMSMSLRAWKNKIALYGMILLLGAANVYVLYRIFVKKHRHNQAAPENPSH